MIKNKNYKYLVGFILGIILFGGSAFATIRYSANMFYYNKNTSTLNSSDVQGAIHELANKYATLSTCPNDKQCLQRKSMPSVGDYLLYTPSSSTYSVDLTKTGGTTAETIYPNELKLWRVISVNQNGTVDIISEYLSSSTVTFRGLTGYENLVGYLNVLASQYETTGITVGSRHFGYSDQTEYITDETYLTSSTTAPWPCKTGESCTPDPDDYEEYGGGDTGYITDYNLVSNAIGTCLARKENSLINTSYWIASRCYMPVNYNNGLEANFFHIWMTTAGNVHFCSQSSSDIPLYKYSSNGESNYGGRYNIRPIVTLSSSLTYRGVGNQDFPIEIIS